MPQISFESTHTIDVRPNDGISLTLTIKSKKILIFHFSRGKFFRIFIESYLVSTERRIFTVSLMFALNFQEKFYVK